MKSKVIVTMVLLLFVALFSWKFTTVQHLSRGGDRFILYRWDGGDLVGIDGKKVNIYDDKSVKIVGHMMTVDDHEEVYPLSYLNLTLEGNRTAVYQFMPQKSINSVELPTRAVWYELIGGTGMKIGNDFVTSGVRFRDENRSLFMVFDAALFKGGVFNRKKTLSASTQRLGVVAFDKGMVMLKSDGQTVPVPYIGDFNDISDIVSRGIAPLTIDEKGFLLINDHMIQVRLEKKPISIKTKSGYRQVEDNFIKITSISEPQPAAYLELISYDKGFVKNGLLQIPRRISLGEKVTLSGTKSLFDAGSFGYAVIPSRIPNFYKQRNNRTKQRTRGNRGDMIYPPKGIYIDDPEALVTYREGNVSLSLHESANNVPYLYLFGDYRGAFLAPPSGIGEPNEMLYDIRTKKEQLKLAANGNVTAICSDGRVLHRDDKAAWSEPYRNVRSIALEGCKQLAVSVTMKKEIPQCGELFDSEVPYELIYRAGDMETFRPLQRSVDNHYSIAMTLDPFKTYDFQVCSMKVSADLTLLEDGSKRRIPKGKCIAFSHRPPLSCRLIIPEKEVVSSIYESQHQINMQSERRRLRPNKSSGTKAAGKVDIVPALLPVFGDASGRFGLGARGVTPSSTMIDINLSRRIAEVFEKRVRILEKNQKLEKLLEKHDELIEGAVVVLRAKDRKVLSMFSYPYPDKPVDIAKERAVDTLHNKKSRLRNRALDMLKHPGSTFKIVTSIAAFNSNVLQPRKLLFFEEENNFKELKSTYDLKNVPFRNNEKEPISFSLKNFRPSRGGYELTKYPDFTHAFMHSYNVYFGYLGLLMHQRFAKHYQANLYPVVADYEVREAEFPLMQAAKDVGFNTPMELSASKNIHFFASHFPTRFLYAKELADTAIGQYEVEATPMQMAMVTGVIYDGDVVYPSIITDEAKNVLHEHYISEDVREMIEKAMGLVTGKGGTAKHAFKGFDQSQVKVYGKTGTAQKGRDGLNDGWFVAYTRGLDEDIIVVCVITNSGTGGSHSAYVVRDVIDYYRQRK